MEWNETLKCKEWRGRPVSFLGSIDFFGTAQWETHKLFNAMQSFSGTTPYQQLPPQLAWSQRRTPPMLRLVRGVAVVVVVVVMARRRVVRSALKEEESIVGVGAVVGRWGVGSWKAGRLLGLEIR